MHAVCDNMLCNACYGGWHEPLLCKPRTAQLGTEQEHMSVFCTSISKISMPIAAHRVLSVSTRFSCLATRHSAKSHPLSVVESTVFMAVTPQLGKAGMMLQCWYQVQVSRENCLRVSLHSAKDCVLCCHLHDCPWKLGPILAFATGKSAESAL